MGKNEKLEKEREKLYQLIKDGASKEEIQYQSEVLDKHVIGHYPISKEV